ncbi:MAG: segregation/condensation protein A [Clostridia bacterium]|nr:segregation/condensation protein A [Clostridia bacterium]
MQNILTLESKKYEIKIENFEGPLDLLCHLIEKNKMNIQDIKIGEITDQYIEYINNMEKLSLEVTSEFLLMASTLLYLKSKNLLPKVVDEEKEITEEELLQRIIDYKRYKEVTKLIKQNYEIFSKRIFKNEEKIELQKQKLERNYEKDIIVKKYEEVIRKNKERLNQNAKNIDKIAITDTYTVGEKVKEMFKEMIRRNKFTFNKLYTKSRCSSQEIVTAFTGLLELSKRSKVRTEQQHLFGEITVEKKVKKNKS